MSLALVVCGAQGRMGTAFVQHCESQAGVSIVATVGRDESLGQVLATLDAKAVVVDLSVREVVVEHAAAAAQRGCPYVVGVTGLDENEQKALFDLSKQIPILLAPNASLGANLLRALSIIAAKAMPEVDVEIVETHHRLKKDAPSGLAMQLGSDVAHARKQSPASALCFNRHEQGQRRSGEIGVVGLRGGDSIGTHTVHFLGEAQSLELTHRATDRVVFAAGLLQGARFLARSHAGFYNMFDVLNLSYLCEDRKSHD